MNTLREQTDAKFENTRKNNPEFARQIDELLSSAQAFEAGANAIKVGQKAPDFALPNPQGEIVSLSAFLTIGPVVVTFYRGSWCPYCNLQMRAMQERLSDIHALVCAVGRDQPRDAGRITLPE